MAATNDAERAIERLARGLLRADAGRALACVEEAWPALERDLASFIRALRVPPRFAEDCGQATLLRVWRGRREYRGATRAEFFAWLYRICRNECWRSLGKAGDGARALAATDGDELESPTVGPAARAELGDEQRAIERCLAELEPEARQVVELLYSDRGPTEREVAAMIGRSKSRVNQLRQAALRALRSCLERRGRA